MTSASRPLNVRTWSSFLASAAVNVSSSVTVPNRSSLDPDSVPDRSPRPVMVSFTAWPLPSRLRAPTVRTSDTAPFLLAPFGPSAWASCVAVRARSSTPSGTAVRLSGITAPSASSGPPV